MDSDRFFEGDGSRYQNIWGKPPHWWNISFDTQSKPQRAARNVLRLIYTIWVVACVMAVLLAGLRAR